MSNLEKFQAESEELTRVFDNPTEEDKSEIRRFYVMSENERVTLIEFAHHMEDVKMVARIAAAQGMFEAGEKPQ